MIFRSTYEICYAAGREKSFNKILNLGRSHHISIKADNEINFQEQSINFVYKQFIFLDVSIYSFCQITFLEYA
jgi:hypothetical protein